MPRRLVPFLLLLGALGIWAGPGLSALPPPPSVTVPTVTVPQLPPPPVSVPVPLPPPPPAVTAPPNVEPPPLPATPPPPVEVTVPAPPVAESSSQGLRSKPANSAGYTTKARMKRRAAAPARKHRAVVRAAERRTAAPVARATRVQAVTAAVRGPFAEDEGFLSGALGTLDDPGRAIPGALLAMAALAVFLFGLASMPPPVRTSWAGAMLVHKRGSIASAGGAALVMAAATYLLL